MLFSLRSYGALAGALAIHAAALSLSGHSSDVSSSRQQGSFLPPVTIEVAIHPPALVGQKTTLALSEKPIPESSPVETDATGNVRLLTPPVVPIGVPKPKTHHPASKPGIIDLTYFPTSALTERPIPLQEPKATLPEKWLEASGQTVITLYISATGKVDEVSTRHTNLPPELLESVVNAFKGLSFSPGKINGKAVASMMTIEADLTAKLNDLH